jgi:hypothetical protein
MFTFLRFRLTDLFVHASWIAALIIDLARDATVWAL